MDAASTYLLSRLPLLLLFGGGYVLYRLMDATGLAEALAAKALEAGRGRIVSVLAAVVASAGFLSLLVSNTITVLALLPTLKELDEQAKRAGVPLTTALTLSVVYGANIGGMGSLIGSPANMLLLGALDYFHVPGAERITFGSWLLWALPLVLVLLAIALALVLAGAVPRRALSLRLGVRRAPALNVRQRRASAAIAVFLAFWTLDAAARSIWPGYTAHAVLASCLFTAAWLVGAMLPRPRLLTIRDLFSGVPRRGLLFAALLGVVLVAVRIFRLDDLAASAVADLIGKDAPVWLLYLGTALSVILLTEIFSNTIVATAFFGVIHAAALAHGAAPLPLMILVSTASTCAFMTPAATPVNALAFGEMRGTSLWRMLALGLILNLAAALLMTAWINRAIPFVYGIS
ncbi:MAG: solute carrier family 13 (sodium-dependent dicarboxylate transporter), er 2/3/5 [Desulfovibrionales bacterium]|nr:solute carrier family 13 (sodium-dependent dicarboxylate transporter), er 2/3/5 [Desulfovibrionales bacterium]